MQSQPSPRQEIPEAHEVASRIWQFTIPIPFPLKTVNMYALVGSAGWTLIDTGMGTPEARDALAAALNLAGLRIEELRAIVLTHHHPDHVGLSGELQEQSQASVYMHPIEIDSTQQFWSDTLIEHFGDISYFFTRHGLPPTQLWYMQTPRDVMRAIIRVPPREAFTPVTDGQMLELSGELYRIIWVPGHADGQICLLRERDGILLAADHVLPRITPNIGLYSEQDRPDPLADYLTSLQKVAHLPVSLILPGHGEPFHALTERCAEIQHHHQERLQQILNLLRQGPAHAYQLTEQLFGPRLRNDEARRMALAEVLAHLEYLQHRKQLVQLTQDQLFYYQIVDSTSNRAGVEPSAILNQPGPEFSI